MAYILPNSSIILTVDQSKTSRDLLKQNLNQLNYRHIIDSDNGKDALSKLEIGANSGLPFSLVICDWEVANANGLEFLLNIRSSPFSKRTPLVIVSSNTDLANVLTNMSVHIDGYIIKPYTRESLKLNLEAALSGIKP